MSGIRFSGIASGMDTETMVKQLMDVEKLRLNKYNQQKQINLWTQEAYNDTNKDIANFIIDTKKELGVGFGGSIGSASWIKKATSSDTSIFDATANSNAVSGTHSINIDKLASGTTAASESSVTDGTLKDLMGIADGGTYTIEINGGTAGGGADVTFLSSDTLADVASKINKAQDKDGNSLGIKASYDATAERFFISTTGTGSSAKININEGGNGGKYLFENDGTAGHTSILKLKVNYRDAGNADVTGEGMSLAKDYTGGDAQIDFDGANDIKYPSNNITINDININLKSTGTATVKVDTDVNEVYDKIKGFVDKYNELIDKLNKKTSEKSYRDYKPLSDEEKQAMDEKTIELWEEKAKSGLLKNNEHITKLLGNVRAGLYEPVYNTYDEADETTGKLSGFSFLTEIGITTGNYQEKGKLQIDEDKLKEAITNDADGVMDLLFKTPDSTTTDDKEKRAETGLINRLYDDMIDGMKNIIDKSGTGDNAPLYREVKSTILIDFVTKSSSISLLDKDVTNIKTQISRENSRLSNIEDRYWRQFTAMEKAMNQMNSQSSWLASQMGGM